MDKLTIIPTYEFVNNRKEIVDFLCEYTTLKNNYPKSMTVQVITEHIIISNYSELAARQPERWMFEPCDKNGNKFFLEEDCLLCPYGDSSACFDHHPSQEELQESYQQVLFTGFDKDMLDFYLNHTCVEALAKLDTFIFTRAGHKLLTEIRKD